jgi:hypothetical protein
MRQAITPRTLSKIVDLIPDSWLTAADDPQTPAEKRMVYKEFLTSRLANSSIFVKQANNERERLA